MSAFERGQECRSASSARADLQRVSKEGRHPPRGLQRGIYPTNKVSHCQRRSPGQMPPTPYHTTSHNCSQSFLFFTDNILGYSTPSLAHVHPLHAPVVEKLGQHLWGSRRQPSTDHRRYEEHPQTHPRIQSEGCLYNNIPISGFPTEQSGTSSLTCQPGGVRHELLHRSKRNDDRKPIRHVAHNRESEQS